MRGLVRWAIRRWIDKTQKIKIENLKSKISYIK
jgi:hypothetical protein